MSQLDPIPALKGELGAKLAPLISGWNNDDIAYMLGTDRRRIPELRRGSLERFSLERLIRFLARFDYRVEITVQEERSGRRDRSRLKE
jgi:predicted XRE-type DNA-binding protein